MDRFDAFISYSHAADGRLAPAVQSGLQRLAKRVFQRRALRVFRDETGLSTNPHLWGSIEDALTSSDWFVLLASPEAAASQWVDREVATFLTTHPVDHLLVVVTSGDLRFTSDGHVDTSVTTCLPSPLIAALEDEPRWLDLRWAHDDSQLDLRNGRFRAAIADLAAPIHGVAKEDLEGEDVRQQRRAKRLAVVGVTAVGLFAVAAVVAAGVALDQRSEAADQRDEARTQRNVAEQQRAEAEAQRAAAEAERERADTEANVALTKGLAAQATALTGTDLDLSLLLAVEGYRRNPSLDTETGLLTALNGGSLVDSVVDGLPDGIVDIESGGDRSSLFVLTVGGDLLEYDAAAFTQIGEPVATGIVNPWVLDMSRDGSHLAYTGGAGTTVIDLQTRTVVASDLGGGSGSAALSPDGSRVAVTVIATGRVDVFDAATSSVTHTFQVLDAAAGFIDDDRLALQQLGSPVLEVYALDTPAGPPLLATDPERMVGGGGIEVSPDGSLIIAGGLEGTAVLLDSATLEPVSPVIATDGSRTGDFSFSADGSLVSLSSDDGSATVATTSGDVLGTLRGLTGSVVTDFLDGYDLVSASTVDSTALRWQPLGSALGSESLVPGLIMAEVFADGEQAVTASLAGQVTVAPVANLGAPVAQQNVGEVIRAIDVSEAAGLAAVYSIDTNDVGDAVLGRSVDLFSLPDLEVVRSIPFGDAPVSEIAFNPDGTQLAVGYRDGNLAIFDVATGEIVVEPFPVDEFPCCLGLLVWSPDGTRFFAGGQDGILHVLDTVTWTESARQVLVPAQLALREGRLSDDGSILVVPAESGEVFLVDVATGEPIGEPFISAGTQLQQAALLDDGRLLAAMSRDGSLRLWDVATRRAIGPALSGHAGFATAFELLAPDEALSLGANGTVFTWSMDAATWVELACSLAGRNLSREEWELYVGGDYRATCAQWPEGS